MQRESKKRNSTKSLVYSPPCQTTVKEFLWTEEEFFGRSFCVLLGKQILQQLCQDKVGWDESLPDELRKWWLQDLKNLSSVRIKQWYIPANFTDVKKYEFHHVSDASVTGYGECSYLRTINTNGVLCTYQALPQEVASPRMRNNCKSTEKVHNMLKVQKKHTRSIDGRFAIT